MSIINQGSFKVLNVRAWRTLYRADAYGNIERSERTVEHWIPLISHTARRSIWKEYKRQSHRIPWREDNDEDIEIHGFTRLLHPLGPRQLVGWFRCVSCGAMYTDTPELVDKMRQYGCEQPQCANHHPMVIESVLKTCGGCGEEVYDTHGEIDACPKCHKPLKDQPHE